MSSHPADTAAPPTTGARNQACSHEEDKPNQAKRRDETRSCSCSKQIDVRGLGSSPVGHQPAKALRVPVSYSPIARPTGADAMDLALASWQLKQRQPGRLAHVTAATFRSVLYMGYVELIN